MIDDMVQDVVLKDGFGGRTEEFTRSRVCRDVRRLRGQKRRAWGGRQDVSEGSGEDSGEVGGEVEAGEGDGHCVCLGTSDREMKKMRTSMFSTCTRFVVSEKPSSHLASKRLTTVSHYRRLPGVVDTTDGEIGLGTGSGAARLAATTEEPEDEETENGDMER